MSRNVETDHTDIAPGPGAPQPANVPTSSGAPPEKSAFGFFLVLMALFLGLGAPLQSWFPFAGLLWTQLFVFLLLPFLAAAGSNLRVGPFLRLARPPSLREVAIGAASGAALFLVAGAVMSLTTLLLPRSLVQAFDVARLFEGSRSHRLAMAVLAAVLAPLSEEISFRGYTLSALGTAASPRGAIVASAFFFAVMHVDPVRFPAVLLLGIYLGWLAWRSGSIWPAVAAHAVNNGLGAAIIAADRPDVPEQPEVLPILAILALGTAVLVPLALAWIRVTPTPPPAEEACVPRDPTDPSIAFSPRRLSPGWKALAGLGFATAAALVALRVLRGGAA